MVSFYEFDAFHPEKFPDVQELETKADFVLSTLVLEHLPLVVFFKTIRNFLKEGGYVIVTNMHAAMGKISQAGFLDEETGRKVRGHSFAHEIEEALEEGGRWGLKLVGHVGERAMREEDVGEGRVVGVRGKKWIGVECWFGFILKFQG